VAENEHDDNYTDVDPPPPDEAPPIELGLGTEVGGYIIDGELGRGGMGVVYAATHPVIGKRAAIKVLRPSLSKNPTAVERFIQEARAVNQIGHPSIVDIFAFDRLPDGRAYLVMDLLVGESLRKRLRRGPLHLSEGASVIDEVSAALMAAHDKGFIHRDLKPDNVYLVPRDGRWPEVKLLDFGLAKLLQRGESAVQTKTGVLLGTPDYMSPEQARGKDVDHRTDIYALGVLTFEILTGKRPFPKGETPLATLQAHVEQTPPSLADEMPNLPPEIGQLANAMLAKDPDDRPSLSAVRTVIKRLRSNTVIPTMSVASLEISLPAKLPVSSAQPSAMSLTAMKLGAEPLVPSMQARGLDDLDSVPTAPSDVRRLSQPPILRNDDPRISQHAPLSGPVIVDIRQGPPTQPPVSQPMPSGSTSGLAANSQRFASTVPGTLPQRSPTNPPTFSSTGSNPSIPPAGASNPSLAPPATSNPSLAPPATSSPSLQVPPLGSSPPHAPVTGSSPAVSRTSTGSGLRSGNGPLAATTFGVTPFKANTSGQQQAVQMQPAATSGSKAWLWIVLAVVVAAGAIIAITQLR